MQRGLERPITKEQYERGVANNGYLTKEDRELVFSQAELYGYGVYGAVVYENNGEYSVLYSMGSSCD